jgi:Fe-S-cluster containining protein
MTVRDLRRTYLRRAWRGLTFREKRNYDCIMLDGGGRCSIYPVRPLQCRIWPFWPNNLASPATWEEAGKRCPGIGQGPTYAFEQIESLRMEMER